MFLQGQFKAWYMRTLWFALCGCLRCAFGSIRLLLGADGGGGGMLRTCSGDELSLRPGSGPKGSWPPGCRQLRRLEFEAPSRSFSRSFGRLRCRLCGFRLPSNNPRSREAGREKTEACASLQVPGRLQRRAATEDEGFKIQSRIVFATLDFFVGSIMC